jgi:hypothetical protein
MEKLEEALDKEFEKMSNEFIQNQIDYYRKHRMNSWGYEYEKWRREHNKKIIKDLLKK